ncbi:hypothetical protein F441_11472 [Phytophthora nicotianae CJ01A1]|uniref:Uncharacterized protein n=6 Tax=Phytophthora nicotianae TaxID=4792 RepID=W2Q2B9_PHYN3|nr:hypothetical protein PPTG_13606 [Phytophthora nicotianae INRA-310]ETI43587.1 hypothetical protein F443_11559 [Phytophthora nicotianae P1569]ETK83621.1 hypothetical protein L915_11245 [Phytophthora nicotianae]ETO72215.1 hypothetical protein F444_11629 [Phytophthora nicotianae P1976]ETP13362.1 hypothetical protein F441_11472 [Phytophthora nicotianae CJ01A1]ETP41431.1 hypothetical protein F442_11454 [Phytophthora nicotianae P10297]
MQQTGPWRWSDQYSFCELKEAEAHRAALSLRQEALKNELLRMRQQQFVMASRERHNELRSQVQRLEQQIHHYELKTFNAERVGRINDWTDSTAKDAPLPFAQLDERLAGSSETLIAKLAQQNEQIMALLIPRRQDKAHASGVPSISTLSPPPHPSSKTDSTSRRDPEHEKTMQQESQSEIPIKNRAPTFQTPSVVSWLPEFEWTDEDEIALDKLENDADFLIDNPESDDVTGVNHDHEIGASANTKSTLPKDQKARNRLESHKKLEALLSASLKNVGGGALRKPRWRLEAGDVISPFESEAEAMKPLQIFRSAVLGVLFVVYLKDILMTKKLAEKKSTMLGFESMLRVYFDATRMWLGKVVRTPLLSLLQDASLDVDISTRGGLTGFRGFARKFGDILSRRPPPSAQSLASNGQSSKNSVDPAKLLKLKVRMRGILQALSKAIDKREVPSGILDFWKRISSDGVYFPPSYQLFNEERESLEFDALGATERMDFAVSTVVDQNVDLDWRCGHQFSRFNVVLVNFLFIRILIPHVILQPWNVGIGSKIIGKQTAANLASLATLLYCVCKQLSPLPPLVQHSDTPVLGRRRSKTVTILQSSTSDENAVQGEIDSVLTGEAGHSVDTAFMSIDEIGRRLISEKSFPSEDPQVIQVVEEHHLMLQETLTRLRSQLHGSQE